ncbi:hypothetical protein JL720_8143 [Aureococcus anophagefferens]|nr:hypothetical protein JL720_8143 [Aureococcus anophagefferens]
MSHPFPAQVLATAALRACSAARAAALTCAGDCAARADPPRPGDAARCYEAAVAEVAKALGGGGGGGGGAQRSSATRLGVAVARRDLGDDAGFRDAAGKYLGASGAAALPAEEAATQSYEPWSQSDEALTMPFELKQEPDDAPRPAARALAVAPRPAPDAGGGLGAAVHLRLPAGRGPRRPRRAARGAGGGGGTGTAAAAATAAPAAATAAPATAAAAAARGAEILISLPFFSVQIPLGTMCRLLGRKLTVKILQRALVGIVDGSGSAAALNMMKHT